MNSHQRRKKRRAAQRAIDEMNMAYLRALVEDIRKNGPPIWNMAVLNADQCYPA